MTGTPRGPTFEFVSKNSNVNSSPRDGQIRSGAALAALVSPVRQEIVDALEAAGAMSMAELAERIGRPADALYFHVRRLVRVGLVVERAPLKAGRHVKAIYDLPGRPMRIRYDPAMNRQNLARVVAAAQRIGLRDFTRAVSDSQELGTQRAGHRVVWGGRSKGWLSKSQVREVNRLIEEVQAVFREGRPGRGRQAVGLSFVLAPCAPPRRAAQGGRRSGHDEA